MSEPSSSNEDMEMVAAMMQAVEQHEAKATSSSKGNDASESEEETRPAKRAKANKSSKAVGKGNAGGGSPSKASKWTDQDKLLLFEAVVSKANMTKKDFEDVAVEIGKTSAQCHDTWRQVLLKKIKTAVAGGL